MVEFMLHTEEIIVMRQFFILYIQEILILESNVLVLLLIMMEVLILYGRELVL